MANLGFLPFLQSIPVTMSTASAACGETSTSRRSMGTFISSQACASITWCLTAKASFASSRFMWREQKTQMTRRSAGCQSVSMTSPLSWQRNKSWSMKKCKSLGNPTAACVALRLLNVFILVNLSFESFLIFQSNTACAYLWDPCGRKHNLHQALFQNGHHCHVEQRWCSYGEVMWLDMSSYQFNFHMDISLI